MGFRPSENPKWVGKNGWKWDFQNPKNGGGGIISNPGRVPAELQVSAQGNHQGQAEGHIQ